MTKVHFAQKKPPHPMSTGKIILSPRGCGGLESIGAQIMRLMQLGRILLLRYSQFLRGYVVTVRIYNFQGRHGG